MSRSNPQGGATNPAEFRFEWDGANGGVRYWDKAKEEQVEIGNKFTFIFLDQVGTVRGYSKRHGSIFSNEVRDTKAQPLVVRWKNGDQSGELCSGIWQEIKDTVTARGGKFAANCYVAFKQGEALKIGVIQFKGASLNSWIDFMKKNRAAVHEKAVKIDGATDHTSGDVDYKCPVFKIVELSAETNAEAVELDKALQEHFKAYFSQPTKARAAQTAEAEPKPKTRTVAASEPIAGDEPPENDDVPF